MPTELFDARMSAIPPRLAIEASAGTGKTTAVATVVRRFIGEYGVAPEEIAVTTFTRAAASELRSRIRREIADRRLNPTCPPGERALLDRALESIASMQISTIHGFAQRSLAMLGDPAAQLRPVATDAGALRRYVADAIVDLAARGVFEEFDVSVDSASRHLGTLLNAPGADVLPAATNFEPNLASMLLVRARELLACSNARRGVFTYTDLITTLEERLVGHLDAAKEIARRYRLLVIDEFQDTDAHQWAIFDTIAAAWSELAGVRDAGEAPRTVVVVGDPKQSIYAFRGADLTTYKRATSSMERRTLSTNFRSSDQLIEAYNVLFRNRNFHVRTADIPDLCSFPNDGDVLYEPVAPPSLEQGRDRSDVRYVPSGPDAGAPITVRWAPHDATDTRGFDEAIGEDLVQWLIREKEHAQVVVDGVRRDVKWSDFCVLAKTNRSARDLLATLSVAKVPAALIGTTSVLDSPATIEWRLLLEALGEPGAIRSAKLYASTWFGGATDLEITASEESILARWQDELVRFRTTFDRSGPAGLVAEVLVDGAVEARVIERTASPLRHVTDLHHVAEILATMPVHSSLEELSDAIDGAKYEGDVDDVDVEDELLVRRMEGDDDAVRVMTVHSSKGLEFPIVLIPDLWKTGKLGLPRAIALQRDGGDLERSLLLPQGGKDDVKQAMYADQASEASRLFYVACTRAKHQVVMWWCSPAHNQHKGWMNDLLSEATEAFNETIEKDRKGSRQAFRSDPNGSMGWLGTPKGLVNVQQFEAPLKSPHRGGQAPQISGEVVHPDLAVRPFDRVLPQPIRRWSYSQVTKRVSLPGTTMVSDGEAGFERATGSDGGDGEDYESSGLSAEERLPGDAEPAPDTKELPAGRVFGEYVHRVFELTAREAVDLEAEIRIHAEVEAPKFGYVFGEENHGKTVHGGQVVDMVYRGLVTPLGIAYGDHNLLDIGSSKTLSELRFDFALPYVEMGIVVGAIGDLLHDHLGDHPDFGRWIERIDLKTLALRGSFNGAIDAVVGVQLDGVPRFGVIDYKTNRLDRFDHESMRAAMEQHAYPLQAIFYQVVLHRYLKSRLVNYDGAKHLGPALYLFVRGMGADSQNPSAGIFSFDIPSALVEELSSLLAMGVQPW